MSESPDARLHKLLDKMAELGASDLFLADGKQPGLRIDGRIRVAKELEPVSDAELSALLDRSAGPRRRAEFDDLGDLDVGMSLGPGRRFRINWSRQQGHLAAVCRAVPSGALDLDALGLPPAVKRFSELTRGLVLVTGATGSGKSTTLAALVHRVNRTRPVHIVTIEDPIEFEHQDIRARVSQREVGNDTLDFAAALRHVVRQSPDVIVVGELRDAVSVQVAISAALTGHLVLGTFHTSDVVQTLQRLMSFFPEHQRHQAAVDLSMCLEGVVSQRLVPRADGEGRVLAAELLTVDPATRKLLRDQRLDEVGDLMRTARSDEMLTFTSSLLDLLQRDQIEHAVGRAYSSNPEEFDLYSKGMTTGADTFRTGQGQSSGLDMRDLLRLAMDRGASDLHLTVDRPPIVRVSGRLEAVSDKQLSTADMRMLLHSIMTARQRSTYDLEREVDFSLAVDDGRRYRVNAYHQKGHMAAALRAIHSEAPEAEALGIPEQVLELGMRPHGLMLVVGPTGSGKSTTLACLVDRLNKSRACRIITIEDPIEYTHESRVATVDQRELYADTLSFAAALKYILRQDPDVILVGEMRDFETISAALTAAETGHLVFATLHSNDAIQAIDRIIDVFPAHQQAQARAQLAAALIGVVSQRLLPRADDGGRIAAFEVMVATSGIRNLIREKKTHQVLGLMESSRRDGCVTLDQSVEALYNAGLVDYDEAARLMRDSRRIRRPAPDPVESDPGAPASEPQPATSVNQGYRRPEPRPTSQDSPKKPASRWPWKT